MWDKIFVWTENKSTRKAKDIIDALENGSDGYYIVCDSYNRVWGVGDSVHDVFLNILTFPNDRNLSNEKIILNFPEKDFEIWSLLPAHESLIKAEEALTQAEEAKKIRQDFAGRGLDNFLVCQEINGIVFLKG